MTDFPTGYYDRYGEKEVEMAHKIIRTSRGPSLDETGRPVEMLTVEFLTEKGERSRLKVPVGTSNEAIRGLVREEADKLDALLGDV